MHVQIPVYLNMLLLVTAVIAIENRRQTSFGQDTHILLNLLPSMVHAWDASEVSHACVGFVHVQ